jgi:hypothetical protein
VKLRDQIKADRKAYRRKKDAERLARERREAELEAYREQLRRDEAVLIANLKTPRVRGQMLSGRQTGRDSQKQWELAQARRWLSKLSETDSKIADTLRKSGKTEVEIMALFKAAGVDLEEQCAS